MHRARANHEACDVTLDHTTEMELAVLPGKSCASLSIDWKQFFDRIERQVGQPLIALMIDTEGTSNVARVFSDAENRLMQKGRFRFKIGCSVEKTSTPHASSYFQGPSWLMQRASSFLF